MLEEDESVTTSPRGPRKISSSIIDTSNQTPEYCAAMKRLLEKRKMSSGHDPRYESISSYDDNKLSETDGTKQFPSNKYVSDSSLSDSSQMLRMRNTII